MFGAVYHIQPMFFPAYAEVLEVGCAEADWMTPMLAIRPDLRITGIDWREAKRPARVIRGSVLAKNWTPNTFDAMVGISSIEHIGLGHYDHDPVDVDGDRHCMERVAKWIKPGAWVYLDVPYDPAGFHVEGTSHRVYDDASLVSRLLPGLHLQHIWYFAHADVHHPIPKPEKVSGGMLYAAMVATKAS